MKSLKKMHRNTLCGVILLAIFSPQLCRSLVCYDNVVAEQTVLIGCNFRGAACGVTNKTSVISLYGFNITDNKVLYHCADRSSSCSAGPLNYCNAHSESEQVSCMTSCCHSDKCNLPDDAELKVETVPESKALSCYQLVGDDQKKVKCMFKGAVCMFTDIGPSAVLTSYEEAQNRSGSQLCTTRKFCDGMKDVCGSLYQNDWKHTCTTKCCTTDYCNPLPSYAHYTGHGPHPNAKAVKPDHTRGVHHKTNKNLPKTDAPWLDDSFDYSQFDNPPEQESSEVGGSDYSGYSSSDSNVAWYIVGTIFSLILSLSLAAWRYNRRRATVKYVTMRNT